MFLIFCLCIYLTEFNRHHCDHSIVNARHQDLTLDLRENSEFPGPFLGLRLVLSRIAVAVLTKWHPIECKSSHCLLEGAGSWALELGPACSELSPRSGGWLVGVDWECVGYVGWGRLFGPHGLRYSPRCAVFKARKLELWS